MERGTARARIMLAADAILNGCFVWLVCLVWVGLVGLEGCDQAECRMTLLDVEVSWFVFVLCSKTRYEFELRW